MSRKNKDGGRPGDIEIKINPGEVPRSSLITFPMAKTRHAKSFQAKNINEFVAQVPQSFQVNLRHADGKSAAEIINVQKYEDIGLDNISKNRTHRKHMNIFPYIGIYRKIWKRTENQLYIYTYFYNYTIPTFHDFTITIYLLFPFRVYLYIEGYALPTATDIWNV